MPVVYPVTPPMKANQPTLELLIPMALSRPWTGNGVNTSHFRKPASRTFSAACSTDAAVVNSAKTPYRWVGNSAMERLLVFSPAQGMMRIRLRRDSLHFGDGDHRQEPQEEQETREE